MPIIIPFRAMVPALLLAAYALACAKAATKLVYAGAPYLWTCAGVFALASVGLAFRRRSAWLFALPFFGLSALTYLFISARMAIYLTTEAKWHDWAGVGNLFLSGIAALIFLAFIASLAESVFLVRKPPAFASPDLPLILAAPLALAGLATLVWCLGYQGYWKRFPDQDACLGAGSASYCHALAVDEVRFSPAERLRFARQGCERADPNACNIVAGNLGRSNGSATSSDARILEGRCDQGDAEICLRLGKGLIDSGNAKAAMRHLTRACELAVATCSGVAELAKAGGDAALMRSLLERGCAQKNPTSCSALLRKVGPSLAEPEQSKLHLEVCLATDVNECIPLIRRDATGVCPIICDGDGGNRMQSCDYCGKYARDNGRIKLAEAWFGRSCDKGYERSCVNLGELLVSLGRESEAATWFAKACDPRRNISLGCARAKKSATDLAIPPRAGSR